MDVFGNTKEGGGNGGHIKGHKENAVWSEEDIDEAVTNNWKGGGVISKMYLRVVVTRGIKGEVDKVGLDGGDVMVAAAVRDCHSDGMMGARGGESSEVWARPGKMLQQQ
jgi:hypothetical protein